LNLSLSFLLVFSQSSDPSFFHLASMFFSSPQSFRIIPRGLRPSIVSRGNFFTSFCICSFVELWRPISNPFWLLSSQATTLLSCVPSLLAFLSFLRKAESSLSFAVPLLILTHLGFASFLTGWCQKSQLPPPSRTPHHFPLAPHSLAHPGLFSQPFLSQHG